jgi:2-amino-4-hydroxy-6-hydroxymethyldihydropteridine diphosphokinase
MSRCLIALGSNLGNRREILDQAIEKLRRTAGLKVLSVSAPRETAPVGGPANQPFFLNAAAVLDTSLEPLALLTLLQQIEMEAGRRRGEIWGPRTLDLDMLLYDELVLSTPTLLLPHPRMAWRRFVLECAAEVAGEMRHPVIGWTVARLLEHLNSALPYVAITGAIGVGKSHLARLLCEKTSAQLISEPLDEKNLEIFYENPASHAWATELEFLRRRTELLATDKRDSPIFADHASMVPAKIGTVPRQGAISDFWFDQSLAFARAWLPESQQPALFERWQEAREKVAQPKLIVLLDAPFDVLMDRIRRRGRHGEQYLIPEQLERIRQSIIDQASQPGLGPVLKTTSADIDSTLDEVLAAIKAME